MHVDFFRNAFTLKQGGRGRARNETYFKMVSFKTVNCIKHCLTDKCDRPQLEMLKHTKRFFFPKENSLLTYVSWNMFPGVLGKGGAELSKLKGLYLP